MKIHSTEPTGIVAYPVEIRAEIQDRQSDAFGDLRLEGDVRESDVPHATRSVWDVTKNAIASGKLATVRFDTHGMPPVKPARHVLAAALAVLEAAGRLANSGYGEIFVSGGIGPDNNLYPHRAGRPTLELARSAGCVTAGVFDTASTAGNDPRNRVTASTLNDLVARLACSADDGDGNGATIATPPAPTPPGPLSELTVRLENHLLAALMGAARDGLHTLIVDHGAGAPAIDSAVRRLPAERRNPLDKTTQRVVDLAYSAAGLGSAPRIPFRAPHSTANTRAITGGTDGPGEVTLAHGGFLYLTDADEFSRYALSDIAECLKRKTVKHARPGLDVEIPADFTLLARISLRETDDQAMNERRLERVKSVLGPFFNQTVDVHAPRQHATQTCAKCGLPYSTPIGGPGNTRVCACLHARQRHVPSRTHHA